MDKLLKKLETEYIGKYDGKLKYILNDYSIEEVVTHIMEWLKIKWKETDNLHYGEITTIAKDFYVGSDLTKREKQNYYLELNRQFFFETFSENLFSKEFAICSWTIYTIGKFSRIENATYLEKAYELNYKLTNPILAKQCLGEMTWLNSKKVNGYLDNLANESGILPKLMLLMYWSAFCGTTEFETLILDKVLMNFICPKNELINKDEIIIRLNHFECHIIHLFNKDKNLHLTIADYENKAKVYFENYNRD